MNNYVFVDVRPEDDRVSDKICSSFKMASVQAVLNICSRYFDQSSRESDENMCESCFRLQDYLKVLTVELKSAQLILKLLQDELKTKVNEPSAMVNQPTRESQSSRQTQ